MSYDQFKRNIVRQDELNAIFVRSELDDAGLTPFEFRVYAHIARRADCYAALDTIANICRMSRSQVKRVTRSLQEKGMIHVVDSVGGTKTLSLTPPRLWSDSVRAHIEHVRASGKSPDPAIAEVEDVTPDPLNGVGSVGTGGSPVGTGGESYQNPKGTPSKEIPERIVEDKPPRHEGDGLPTSELFDVTENVSVAQKPRRRNLLGEAALRACSIDPATATGDQWSVALKAVRQIREVYPDLKPEHLLALGDELRRKWSGMKGGFTPGALSKHWSPPKPPVHESCEVSAAALARRQEIAESTPGTEVDPAMAAEFFAAINGDPR